MKLSIITINFNDKEGLQRTFKSVDEQSFVNFEYIVIDGGSTDGSVELIKEYAHLINYWVSEPDRGIYHAINKGIERASGEYCHFLNSGDWLHDGNSLSRVFENNFSEDIVYTNCFFCKSLDGPLLKAEFPAPEELTFKYFINDVICHQAQFIKRALFFRHEMYDESYKIYADYKFLTTAIVKAKASLRHLNLYPVIYNHWGVSAKNLVLKEEEKVKILLKEFPLFGKDYLESDSERRQLQAIRKHPVVNFLKGIRKRIGR